MSTSLFQVDLSGVLKVLSDSLYSSYQVFIRELLQNSVDAIQARKNLNHEFTGKITVSYFDKGDEKTLIVEDNGVGLTLDEVDEFLSKIGSSSKRNQKVNRDSFIGQFGIGLLSCFMVSEEVVVISHSGKTNESVKWVGNINGTYQKSRIEDDLAIGTSVFLKIKEEVHFDYELIVELLHKYADYLDTDVQFIYNGIEKESFNKLFPWEKATLDDSVLRLGREKFNEDFSMYFMLKDSSGQNQGIAYIIPRKTHYGTVNAHQVYIKRMFISDKSNEILPEWAFFIKAIINSSNLSPTASREELYKNGVLDKTKIDLGNCIKEYMMDLGANSPESLVKLIKIHGEALKSLSLEDESFLKFIAQWFVFPTTEGNLTLNEIRKKTKSILYISDLDEFRQVLPVAKANNQLIVNAGYIYDTEILNKLKEIDKKYNYQLIDIEYYGNILSDLPIEIYDAIQSRVVDLQFHLEDFLCELEIKSFEPEKLPAIFYMSQDSMLERDLTNIKEESDDLWSGVTDSLFSFNTQYLSKLFLNYNNPLVVKILTSKNKDLDKVFVQMVYVNALMMGHYPLKNTELELINSNLLVLLEKAL